jgi:hypothetical protein
MARSGYGLSLKYHQGPPYTPETAVSGVARPQDGRPATVFYPLGHPTPYAYGPAIRFACEIVEDLVSQPEFAGALPEAVLVGGPIPAK